VALPLGARINRVLSKTEPLVRVQGTRGLIFVSYSLFQTLTAASSTTEFARIRMAVATVASRAAGVVIVGLVGQRSTIAGGRSGGSMSSMVSGRFR
jgi:hypothetical protein